MARIFWTALMLAFIVGVIVGVSWISAYTALSNVLGSPPPMMGTQHTTLFWKGAPKLRGNPRAWLFAFSPTSIPGAPNVEIYIGPWGRLLQMRPSDLPARIKGMHRQ